MRLFISDSAIFKSKEQRGEAVGGSYIKRVITGRDKDNSPQYRYLRTQEEVEAYEKNHKDEKKDTKVTHEEQKKESKKIKDKTAKKDEDKPSLLVSKDKKKVEKSLYVR